MVEQPFPSSSPSSPKEIYFVLLLNDRWDGELIIDSINRVSLLQRLDGGKKKPLAAGDGSGVGQA